MFDGLQLHLLAISYLYTEYTLAGVTPVALALPS